MSFQRYAEYRESGIEWLGEIPAHWSVRRVATLFREASDKGDDELPILSVSIHDGVSDRELSDNELDRKVTRSDDSSKYKQVRPNDLVYNMMRAWQGGFGSVLVLGQVSPAYVVARPIAELHSRYIEYLLRTSCAVEEMRRRSHGVTDFRLRMYWDDFKSMLIALPDAIEQAAILSFLDREVARINGLVAEQEKLIALLAEKRQAVISHAITKGLDARVSMKNSGVEWLGEVPEHWEVRRIKHLTHTIEQGWSPQCEGFPVETSEEWGVLKVGCVNGGLFDPSENKTLPIELDAVPELGIQAGDLLISRANTRELVGSAAVADADHRNLMLCDKLYRLRLNPEKCIPHFISRYLGTSAARGQIELAATGASSSMVNIGQPTILEMAAPVPPVPEQMTIIAFLDSETAKLDTLTTEARNAIGLLKEHRSALIFAAVTGKIDVRGLTKAEAA